LRIQPKMGGKFHLKLIIDKRPIANKYREGKVKRTLKRGLKVLETTKIEGIEDSIHLVCRIISHGRELGKGSRAPFRWGLGFSFPVHSWHVHYDTEWVSMGLVKDSLNRPVRRVQGR